MTKISIGGRQYPAQIVGYASDKGWNGRDSKAITLDMTYEEARKLFVEDAPWSILYTDGERTYHLESDMDVVHEQIKAANHRISDLEHK